MSHIKPSIQQVGLKIPVLFLIFNRLEVTKLVFEQIKSAKPARLFIASDGARNGKPDERKIVAETREWVLQNVTWDCQVQTLFREKNLGCGQAVSSAITWFFENVEMGIILEDDCLPDHSFFPFCEEMLIKYENDSKVMHIAGTNLFTNINHGTGCSYYFSKYANVWGWASWKRAWNKYDFDIREFSEVRRNGYLRDYFNYYPAYVSRLKWYSAVFQNDTESRTLDTWDYQWCFTCSSNAGLAIVPETNLIKNIGFGEDATHTHVIDSFYSQEPEPMKFPLTHPPVVVVHNANDLIYEKRIFGNLVSTFKSLGIDLLRKYLKKRNVSYLKHL